MKRKTCRRLTTTAARRATTNISLPQPLADYAATRAERDFEGNRSLYFRDLIRRDQAAYAATLRHGAEAAGKALAGVVAI